jgi:hypothetical protein
MRVPVLFILIKFGIFSLHFSHSGGCVVPHFLCLYCLMVLMNIFSCAHCSFSYPFLWSVGSSHLTTYIGLSYFFWRGSFLRVLSIEPSARGMLYRTLPLMHCQPWFLCSLSYIPKENNFTDVSLVCVCVLKPGFGYA